MNIEIAERLIKLRKEKGLSQEELAAKLGLSRQAVSKWERAEASPDTDNLICLARIYGVSLDELLNTSDSVEDIVKEQVKEEAKAEEIKKDRVHIGADGIHVESKDGEQVHISGDGIFVKDKDEEINVGCGRNYRYKPSKYEIIKGAVVGSFTLLAVVAFLLLGFLLPGGVGWTTGWIVFLFIPIVASLFTCFHRRRITAFALPVMVTAVYMFLGMGFGLWHPYWIVFLAIPIFYSIFSPVDKLLRHRRIEKGIEVDIIDNEDEDKD
ncbi:MAG: helix-turn-helix domain-containing protein [Bacilli bacterium]|jgi:transcriptional regulator with XRE-family HTH domain|nr:helix-turn-helix domain-containing protein [Bacilli bacterium]MDD4303190.1 helix-turn-helix domain-containing protein [Bacilli bacterium]NLB40106.1 helix-turn-helix domain-containing protein [Erysipelotrichaceae bacterium]HPY38545.1 helix-turn-helix domain-containing protein [Bacilli bacterium]